MISRRALFGLWAGAAAACIVPSKALPTRIIGVDFGRKPVMIEIRDGYVIDLTPDNIEVDIRFDDLVPDRWLK